MKRKNIKRMVVKVGTSVLTAGGDRPDKNRIKNIVDQIVALMDNGIEVLLVTSGAIGAGMGLLGLKHRPQSLPKMQACAAVGQSHLMQIYDKLFQMKGRLTAQLLLTQDDMADRSRYLNAKNTLFTLLEGRIVPIINENDTVSTEEIKFGDNDRLSSLVANLVGADLLVILSDVEGLYRCDAKGRRVGDCIKEITEISDEVKKLALKTKTRLGVGGMASKIEAARVCINSDVRCVVADGRKKDTLLKIAKGQGVGTVFLPARTKITAKKHWIAHSSRPAGSIIVDDGAKDALAAKNKSLLASGITGHEGNFNAGDVVSIKGKDGVEFARGVVNYSSSDLKKIKGLKTNQIKEILGSKSRDEIVHRNSMAIF